MGNKAQAGGCPLCDILDAVNGLLHPLSTYISLPKININPSFASQIVCRDRPLRCLGYVARGRLCAGGTRHNVNILIRLGYQEREAGARLV